jgi:YNFM family putative membrane transporter
MPFDARRAAVAINGFVAFSNLYSPQALLPELAREFGATPGQIGTIITASTLAIALTAPLTGTIADVLGRKRIITAALFASCIPMILVAYAPDVPSIVALRFIQGLLLPPIFAVTVAYIGDEWPPSQVAGVAGIFVMGSSAGGFAGRMVPGVLSDVIGWRDSLLVLAGMTLVGAMAVSLILPREKKFVRSEGFRSSAVQMLHHFGNPQLVATFAVGFGTLFNFIATFTYVSFHLAAPPYNFSNTLLGVIFVTYLGGTLVTPWTGRLVGRFGRRTFVLGVIALWIAGALLTLAPPLAAILAGLTVCATCGMLCQSVSTSYVTTTARVGRSSAVGLYVTCFYIGGSVGGFLPGLTWASGGWPAAVAMLVAMQAIMATIVARAWTRSPAPS